MSVIVQGMDMPEECNVCPLANYNMGTMYCKALPPSPNGYHVIRFKGKREDCPLIEAEGSVSYKANEMYRELELYDGDTKIGEAEVDINGKILLRLSILEPYQNRGYGQAIVKKLIEDYGITCLWVNADNARAIHVYEKCGFTKERPTIYLMERKGGAE